MLSTDAVLHQVKGIKKTFDEGATKKILKWKDQRVFNFTETAEYNEIFTSTESMADASELTEAQTPAILKLEEGYQVMIEDNRFGSAISVTETMRVKAGDSTQKMRTIIQRQAKKIMVVNYKLFLNKAWGLLNGGFTTTLAPDGNPLFGAHVWKTAGATGFNNNPTNAEFSEAAWDAVVEYGATLKDAANIEMPIVFDTVVVALGSKAAKDAKKLFAQGISPTKVADTNIYESTVNVIESPLLSLRTMWVPIASGLDNPMYVGITKFPSLNKPLIEDNEAVRTNCTGFYKAGITEMPFAICASKGDNS